MAALKSLVISHLRGAVEPFSLTFEKGKKLSIVYGENGTGKSTICDALDFLGNGKVGSLDYRGLGPTSRYWHSIGKVAGDVRVTLETNAGSCFAVIAKRDVVAIPPENKPKVEILRRAQILGLVEAKPAERYSAIRRFIDVSGVEESETNLRKAIIEIERNAEVAVAIVQANRDAVQNFWEQAGRPMVDPFEWATLEVQKDMSALEVKKASIEALKIALNKLLDVPSQYAILLAGKQSSDEQLQVGQAAYDVLKATAASEYLEILEILQAAQKHFVSHPHLEKCPLCDSAENIQGLAERINERIALQNVAFDLKAAEKNVADKNAMLVRDNQRLHDLQIKAQKDAEYFVLCCSDKNLPINIVLPILPQPLDLKDWHKWLENHAELLQSWNTLIAEYTDNTKFINALKSSLQTLTLNNQVKREIDVILPKLKAAHKVVQEERRKFTDQILHDIAGEVGRLYEAVHPGEGLNNVTLVLDPIKRASLEIATDFCGQKGSPPQAYFSDSHLDTLGLCVFLALAKQELPENTILVMDDVLGSVDEPHVDRLILMLYDEAAKFKHCVITTHYRPWKQKLRWGWLKNGQCQFVELTKWSLATGISLIKSIPDIERLRHLLAETPPDPQLVCAKAGVILEAVLDFLTLLYECQVPRRTDGLFTLGDLLPAIDKKLRVALRVEHRSEDAAGAITYVDRVLAPHLEELTRIAQARNVFGCHFSALSFDLLDADALVFAKEVLALVDCLIDQDTGWPRNSKSGSYWATAGETRRLHPLKRPS
jgi:energy-coupling factor transporter ATP-binding protein EcfA2